MSKKEPKTLQDIVNESAKNVSEALAEARQLNKDMQALDEKLSAAVKKSRDLLKNDP